MSSRGTVDERELLLTVARRAEELLQSIAGHPTHSEMHEAVQGLHGALTNFRNWQEFSNEVEIPPVRIKECESCSALFFFAQTVNGSWVPMEVETIDASETIPTWRYVVNFNDVHPRVMTQPMKEDGRVYVDHRQTCGAREGPKHAILAYVRRYKANTERVGHVETDMVKELLEIRNRRRNAEGG
jgi:hypothetical protein